MRRGTIVGGLILLCWIQGAQAAAPEVIRFHGVIAELLGQPPADGTYEFLAEIFDQAAGGTPLYSQPVTSAVAAGAYTIILSPGTPGDLQSAFADGPRFLEITILTDPLGAPVNQTLLPRQEIASVPFALVAQDFATPPSPVLPLADGDSASDATSASLTSTFTPVANVQAQITVPSPDYMILALAHVNGVAAGQGVNNMGVRLMEDDGTQNLQVAISTAGMFGAGSTDTAFLSYLNTSPTAGATYTYVVEARSIFNAISVNGANGESRLNVVLIKKAN